MFFRKKKKEHEISAELTMLRTGIDHQFARLHGEIDALKEKNKELSQKVTEAKTLGLAEQLTLKRAEKAVADVAKLSVTVGEIQWTITDLKQLARNIAKTQKTKGEDEPERWRKEYSAIRVKLTQLTERLINLETSLVKNGVIRIEQAPTLYEPLPKFAPLESRETPNIKTDIMKKSIVRGDTRYKPFSSKPSHTEKTATAYERYTDQNGKSGLLNTRTGEVFMDSSSEVRSLPNETSLDEMLGIDRDIDYDPEEWN